MGSGNEPSCRVRGGNRLVVQHLKILSFGLALA
jgi:hypothetical protein